MIVWLRHFLSWVVSAFRSREDLILENLALRQQLLALYSQRPRRRLTASHKLFWVVLRRLWAGWKEPLILVTPRTVVAWHRAGFRLYWKWLSRARSRGGRRPASPEIRALIFQMVAENPTWGAPGRRPRYAKRCWSRKELPASKSRRRLVLMNHRSMTGASIRVPKGVSCWPMQFLRTTAE